MEPMKRSRWVVVLLWLVPVWLLVSAGGGIWMYFQAQKAKARKESAKFSHQVSAAAMAADMRKLKTMIGPRDPAIDGGIGLTRAAAWIEGTLGPSNTGYDVKKSAGPDQWPILDASIHGTDEKAPALWVVVGYDSATGQDEPSADAALLAEIAAAASIAGSQFPGAVHFVFIPHGHGPTKLTPETRDKLMAMIRQEGPALAVLCLWDFSNGQFVNISTRDATNPALAVVPSAFGTVSPATDGTPLTDALFAAGLPAVRVSASRAEEADADQLTPLTGQLVELIRAVASKK